LFGERILPSVGVQGAVASDLGPETFPCVSTDECAMDLIRVCTRSPVREVGDFVAYLVRRLHHAWRTIVRVHNNVELFVGVIWDV
jgi:hypothetical protein